LLKLYDFVTHCGDETKNNTYRPTILEKIESQVHFWPQSHAPRQYSVSDNTSINDTEFAYP